MPAPKEDWMNPTANTTKTCIVEARVDARSIASLLLFYQKQGMAIRTKSELVCLAIETLTNMLFAAGHLEKVQSTHEANAIMQMCGMGLGRRNERALLAQLAAESRRAEESGTSLLTESANLLEGLLDAIPDVIPQSKDGLGVHRQDVGLYDGAGSAAAGSNLVNTELQTEGTGAEGR
jgi:hypothetical protein